MSGPRPDDDPGIYTMPADAFRVGAQAAAAAGPGSAAPERDPASEPAPPAPDEREPPRPKRERRPRDAQRVRESASAPSPRRRKGWDIALTIVLLVLLLGAVVVAASVALALGGGSEACGSGGRVCRQDILAVGLWIAFTTPLLVLAVTLFLSVVLLIVRRRAFWVPIAGMLLLAALWSLGVFLVWAAT